MILVGNQRGGAKDLALHLLKEENDRVEVREIRGFVADDLVGALQESHALSRGTRCKQHLYSLSLNPPRDQDVEPSVFEETIDRIEDRLGLNGQPRAIVFHEKNGRRHAHAVWCRIDPETMTARQLSFTKTKLQEVAREVYIERDWQMPRGFIDQDFTDPKNYTLAEWQQAKRAERDPKQLKGLFQDAWAISDSKASFAQALEERGFILAKGDRRGFVAVDYSGEAYAVSRWVGLKAKQVKDRLGSPEGLPSVSEAHEKAASIVADRLNQLRAEQAKVAREERAQLERKTTETLARQRAEADALKRTQKARVVKEEQDRQARIRRGLPGFWDRLTGKRKKIEAENLRAAEIALKRDQAERARQTSAQERERSAIQIKAAEVQVRHQVLIRELTQDMRNLRSAAGQSRVQARSPDTIRAPNERPRRKGRSRDVP